MPASAWPKVAAAGAPVQDAGALAPEAALEAAIARSEMLAATPEPPLQSDNFIVQGTQPELSVAVETFKLACLRCPPQLGMIKGQLMLALSRELKTVASFFEDAAVFVLSRMWFDAISGYMLGLHPVPYCGGFLATQCAHEAPAGSQWQFALAALPATALIKHLVEWSGLTSRPGFVQVPTMLKYIVGWAWGFAILQQLAELRAALPALCVPPEDAGAAPSCLGLDAAVTVALTALSGLLLRFVRPWSKKVEFGDTRALDFLEDLVEDLWAMAARALSVMVMLLWYSLSYEWLTLGSSDADSGRLMALWAISVTLVGSALAAGLEQIEIDLKRGSALIAAGERDLSVECAVTYSDLLQDSLAWVAGCAWTDVVTDVFFTLADDPSLGTLIANAGFSALVSAFAVGWFAATGKTAGGALHAGAEATRADVERYFVTNAFAFFVGWVWLVTARNALAILQLVLEMLVRVLDAVTGLPVPPTAADLVVALVGAPALTLLVLTAQNRAVVRLGARLGVEPPPPLERGAQRRWKRAWRVAGASLAWRRLRYDGAAARGGVGGYRGGADGGVGGGAGGALASLISRTVGAAKGCQGLREPSEPPIRAALAAGELEWERRRRGQEQPSWKPERRTEQERAATHGLTTLEERVAELDERIAAALGEKPGHAGGAFDTPRQQRAATPSAAVLPMPAALPTPAAPLEVACDRHQLMPMRAGAEGGRWSAPAARWLWQSSDGWVAYPNATARALELAWSQGGAGVVSIDAERLVDLRSMRQQRVGAPGMTRAVKREVPPADAAAAQQQGVCAHGVPRKLPDSAVLPLASRPSRPSLHTRSTAPASPAAARPFDYQSILRSTLGHGSPAPRRGDAMRERGYML